jgi:hypothetical protein
MSWTDDLHDDLVAAAGRRRRARVRRVATQLATAAGVVALGTGVAVAAITGGDDPGRGGAAGAPARSSAPAAGSGFRVGVLNATTVDGLARSVAQRLQARGYAIGTVTNAPDRVPHTRVFATRDHLEDGHAVAERVLNLPLAQVGELRPETDIGRAAPGADVVVEVGRDLARGIPGVASVALRGVGDAAGAKATARLGGGAISLTITGLPKSNHYALWVAGRFMGFLPPAPGASRVMHGVAALNGGHGAVLVTREATDRPGTPGTIVLRGRLP